MSLEYIDFSHIARLQSDDRDSNKSKGKMPAKGKRLTVSAFLVIHSYSLKVRSAYRFFHPWTNLLIRNADWLL